MSGNSYYVPMSGNGSAAVNSQLLNFPMIGAFFPNTASTPYYKGNGQPPPTIPISYSSQDSTGNSSVASANPWSPQVSPLPWVIGALLGGMLLLRFVHWR